MDKHHIGSYGKWQQEHQQAEARQLHSVSDHCFRWYEEVLVKNTDMKLCPASLR